MVCDSVLLGGGNAKFMKDLPNHIILGANTNAIGRRPQTVGGRPRNNQTQFQPEARALRSLRSETIKPRRSDGQ